MNYRDFKMSTIVKLGLRNSLKKIDDNLCGVYKLFKNNELVYIGSSKNIKKRIRTHISDGLKDFNRFSYILVDEKELLEKERHEINQNDTIYNNGLMCNNSIKKDEFIKIRISTADKETLRITSERSGKSMSRIIMDSALKECKRLLKNIEKLDKGL